MAYILSLDTSTEACSVALKLDDEVIEDFRPQPRMHTRLVLPMVESLLADAGIGLKQLDCIAFANGPGSFTGLRIATGVTQGLAFGADLPVVPVTTLESMAFTLQRKYYARYVISALDARMGEIYWAAYHWQGDRFFCVAEPQVTRPERVDLQGLSSDADWIGAGNGWAVLDQLSPVMSGAMQQVYPDIAPRAGDIARLAELYWKNGEAVTADQALPLYVRDNVALRKGEGSHR